MCLFRASKHAGACHTGREALMQDSPTSALGRGRSQQTQQQRFSPDETNLFHFLSSVSETANYCFTFQQRGRRPCRRLNPASKTHAGLKHSCIRSQMCTLHTHTHTPHVEVCVCFCVCAVVCVASGSQRAKPLSLSI